MSGFPQDTAVPPRPRVAEGPADSPETSPGTLPSASPGTGGHTLEYPASLSDAGRVAVFGGVYSNHLALEAAIEDARARGAEALLCLGDLGAFGPSPDRTAEILRGEGIPVVRGNYDDSISRGLDDCQCGYTDPTDNHYAHLSYTYTLSNTSSRHREWMGTFPHRIRFRLGGLEVLAFHGSPRRMNEFLWETTTPTHFLQRFADDHAVDLLLGTHTGIHWSRQLDERRWYLNAGALGRPANDGNDHVWYLLLDVRGERLHHTFVPVSYDVEALAGEMRREGLPEEFVKTIRTGWWTTCLEVLPGKERARGRW